MNFGFKVTVQYVFDKRKKNCYFLLYNKLHFTEKVLYNCNQLQNFFGEDI